MQETRIRVREATSASDWLVEVDGAVVERWPTRYEARVDARERATDHSPQVRVEVEDALTSAFHLEVL